MTLVVFRLLLIPSRFLFSGLRFVLFNTFVPAIFFASLSVFILSLSPPLFFFLCYRDLPVNQFNPNFLPSISTKTVRNEFQVPLNYSFFWNHRIQALKYRLFNSDSEKISYWSSNELVYKKVQKLSFIFLLPELLSFCPMNLILTFKTSLKNNLAFVFFPC